MRPLLKGCAIDNIDLPLNIPSALPHAYRNLPLRRNRKSETRIRGSEGVWKRWKNKWNGSPEAVLSETPRSAHPTVVEAQVVRQRGRGGPRSTYCCRLGRNLGPADGVQRVPAPTSLRYA